MRQADGVRGSATTSSPRRRMPLDLRTSEHRVSDLGDDPLAAQVCHGERDLGGINSLG